MCEDGSIEVPERQESESSPPPLQLPYDCLLDLDDVLQERDREGPFKHSVGSVKLHMRHYHNKGWEPEIPDIETPESGLSSSCGVSQSEE